MCQSNIEVSFFYLLLVMGITQKWLMHALPTHVQLLLRRPMIFHTIMRLCAFVVAAEIFYELLNLINVLKEQKFHRSFIKIYLLVIVRIYEPQYLNMHHRKLIL